MHDANKNNTASQKRCSIVSVGGHIVVIDHYDNDRVIEPTCGVDAMAHYAFLSNSPKHGGLDAAQDFLVQIADGGNPITNLVRDIRSDGVYRLYGDPENLEVKR